MIELKDIDDKWYDIDKETLELRIREDAPEDVKRIFYENMKAVDDLEKHIYKNFGKKKGKKQND